MPDDLTHTPQPTFQPSDTICAGKYRLVRQLGAGSYGVVWLAEEVKSHNTQVAIKVARANEEAAARFDREISLSRMLDAHPNVLNAETVEQEGGSLMLVLRYMPGGSLQQRLQAKKPLPVDEALSIAAQVANGLAYLHEQDIIHRDLHPGNILFNARNVPRIADLGLAQCAQFSSSTWYGQKTSQHPGNIFYHPPEASAVGDTPLLPLNPSADVYMLGAVLWEMLTGRLYYHKKGTRPSELNTELPAWLDELVMGMLAQNPDDRPRDGKIAAQKLGEALTRLQREHQQRLEGMAEQTRQAIRLEKWDDAEKHIAVLEKEGKAGAVLAEELRKKLPLAKIDAEKREQQRIKDEEAKEIAKLKQTLIASENIAISLPTPEGIKGVLGESKSSTLLQKELILGIIPIIILAFGFGYMIISLWLWPAVAVNGGPALLQKGYRDVWINLNSEAYACGYPLPTIISSLGLDFDAFNLAISSAMENSNSLDQQQIQAFQSAVSTSNIMPQAYDEYETTVGTGEIIFLCIIVGSGAFTLTLQVLFRHKLKHRKLMIIYSAGILALGLGLIIGWFVFPVEWTDLGLSSLHESFQEAYLRMAISAYSCSGNSAEANIRYRFLGSEGDNLLPLIESNPGNLDLAHIRAFEAAVK